MSVCVKPINLYYGKNHPRYGYVLRVRDTRNAFMQACTEIRTVKVRLANETLKLGNPKKCQKQAMGFYCTGKVGLHSWKDLVIPIKKRRLFSDDLVPNRGKFLGYLCSGIHYRRICAN